MKRKIFELTVALYRVTDHFPEEEVLKQQIRRASGDVMAGVIEYDFFPRDPGRILNVQANLQTLRSLLGVAKINEFVKPINIAVLDREYSFFYGFFERELEATKTPQESKTTFKNENKSPVEKENDILLLNDISSLKNEAVLTGVRIDGEIPKSDGLDAAATVTDQRKKQFVEKSITFSERISVNGNGNGHGSNTPPESVKAHVTQISKGKDFGSQRSPYNERQQSIIDYVQVNQSVKSTDLGAIFSNRFSIKTLQRDLAFLMDKNVITRDGDKRWAVYKMRK